MLKVTPEELNKALNASEMTGSVIAQESSNEEPVVLGKFEMYLWYGQPLMFFKQTQRHGLWKSNWGRRGFRTVALLMMTGLWVLLAYNMGTEIWRVIPAFTQWSLVMTTLFFMTSLVVIETGDEQPTPQEIGRKKAWKLFTLFFNIALMSECLVSIYFWGVLWGQFKDTKRKDAPWHNIMGLVCNHSVPLTLLMIEYVCFNSVLFTYRNLWVALSYSACYLVFNFTWTKVYMPVYPDMTWSGFLGLTLPWLLCLIAVVSHVIFCGLTRLKLRKLGHVEILDLIANLVNIHDKM